MRPMRASPQGLRYCAHVDAGQSRRGGGWRGTGQGLQHGTGRPGCNHLMMHAAHNLASYHRSPPEHASHKDAKAIRQSIYAHVLHHHWVAGKGVFHAQPVGWLGFCGCRGVARRRLLQPLLRPSIPLLPQVLGDCGGEARGRLTLAARRTASKPAIVEANCWAGAQTGAAAGLAEHR